MSHIRSQITVRYLIESSFIKCCGWFTTLSHMWWLTSCQPGRKTKYNTYVCSSPNRILFLKWRRSTDQQCLAKVETKVLEPILRNLNHRQANFYFGGRSFMHGKRIINISLPTTDQRHILIMSPSRVYSSSTMNRSISIPISLGLYSSFSLLSLPMPLPST